MQGWGGEVCLGPTAVLLAGGGVVVRVLAGDLHDTCWGTNLGGVE